MTASTLRIVAIDGPAGSGKSTVARAAAERLGLEYLDTGAMYRAVAFAALRRGVDPTESGSVAAMMETLELSVDGSTVVVDDVDASVEIRGREVSSAVRYVAANPVVRAELQRRQREWAIRRGGGVMEGRDIGSVVFPDAWVKVYLTADPAERARRRAQELGEHLTDRVAADLAARDAADSERAHDPLVEAEGAVIVDTTGLSIDDVVGRIVALAEEASE